MHTVTYRDWARAAADRVGPSPGTDRDLARAAFEAHDDRAGQRRARRSPFARVGAARARRAERKAAAEHISQVSSTSSAGHVRAAAALLQDVGRVGRRPGARAGPGAVRRGRDGSRATTGTRRTRTRSTCWFSGASSRSGTWSSAAGEPRDEEAAPGPAGTDPVRRSTPAGSGTDCGPRAAGRPVTRSWRPGDPRALRRLRRAADGNDPARRRAPGTGKTFTIAALTTSYVAEGACRSTACWSITFTRMATGELRERVRERLVDAFDGLADVLAGRAVPKATRSCGSWPMVRPTRWRPP